MTTGPMTSCFILPFATGKGTATADWIDLLGLNIHKAVIFSFVREDLVDRVMNCLDEKFTTIKNGKGIAFSLPVSDVVGLVQLSAENSEKNKNKHRFYYETVLICYEWGLSLNRAGSRQRHCKNRTA